MLNKNYWQDRYKEQQTGWDTGAITTPIKDYFDALNESQKKAKILIPGCGNAHEATYLYNQGFLNVFICDWAAAPLENFANQNPSFPKEQLIHANFFDLEIGNFDYVIEQTFFCAIDPALRSNYATKMAAILKKGGKLVGLLFSEKLDTGKEGPPFNGTIEEYLGYFQPLFSSVNIEPCQNSITPRLGVELFMELVK